MLSGFFGGFIVYERASSSRFLTPTVRVPPETVGSFGSNVLLDLQECEAFTTMFRDAGNIPATAVIVWFCLLRVLLWLWVSSVDAGCAASLPSVSLTGRPRFWTLTRGDVGASVSPHRPLLYY
jgi:hypothetical protein